MTAVVTDITMGHVMGLSDKVQREFLKEVARARQIKNDPDYKAMIISNAAWRAKQEDEREAEAAAIPPAKVLEFRPRSQGCTVRPSSARRLRTPAAAGGMTMPVA